MARVGSTGRRAKIPAAQYLRMSTEHQRYSLENQAAAIGRYARARGYEVVKTYSDAGISGLQLKNRKALQALLADTVAGDLAFNVILVFDVSRWGRFQNPDQSAHYEFLCAEAGVRVEYCAEPFDNDGSMSSTLLKNLKRVMAAEFSRDLSAKVRAGRARLARKGYWLYGSPGLGFRRQMVDERDRPVAVLEAGQRKAIQSYRTVLAPGPAAEIALVNRIYRLYVEARMTRRAIARLLNAEGLLTDLGLPWTHISVRTILTSPKYLGELVYYPVGKVPRDVGARPKAEDRAWRSAAHKPLVGRSLFEAAQKIRSTREVHMTDEEMLAALRRLWEAHGKLTYEIVTHAPGVPATTTFRKRFGSMRQAFEAIGYHGRRTAKPCVLADEELLRRLAGLLEAQGYLSARLVNRARNLPCCGALTRRFGSIRQAFALAGYVPMKPDARKSPVGRARLAAATAARHRLSCEQTVAPPPAGARPATDEATRPPVG